MARAPQRQERGAGAKLDLVRTAQPCQQRAAPASHEDGRASAIRAVQGRRGRQHQRQQRVIPDEVLRGADLVESHEDEGLCKEAEWQVAAKPRREGDDQSDLWHEGES